ncbi:helix-turn-helix domain-containing protein [Thermoproteota archaeon]
MASILKDILELRIDRHMKRLDHLTVAASTPLERLEEGIENINELTAIIKASTGIRKGQDPLSQSNRLAGFFNDRTVSTTIITNDLGLVAGNLLSENCSTSLAMTLLHNAVAARLGMEYFNVLCEDDHYAPYLSIDGMEYSIHLKSAENRGIPVRFRDSMIITNLEAIAILAEKSQHTCHHNKKEYLQNFRQKLLGTEKDPDTKEHITEYAAARAKTRLSQSAVARKLGITRGGYAHYETGRNPTSPEMDKKIRAILRMDSRFKTQGDEYKHYRQMTGMSQDDVAALIGKVQSAYSYIERGMRVPPPELDRKIREVLGMEESETIDKKVAKIEKKAKPAKKRLLGPRRTDGIGTEYKQYRLQKGMNQYEMAAAIGKGQSTYSDYEQGLSNPPADVDRNIRYVLGMEIDFENVCEEYRFYREKKGMNQYEMAATIGKAQSTYCDYEKGNINPPADVDRTIRYVLEMDIHFDDIKEEYKFYRTKKELSQQKVADAIGKARETYSNYETGAAVPTAGMDDRIREVLGIKERFFYKGSIYRKARHRLKLSVDEVCEHIGKKRSALHYYERSDTIPDIYTAKKLKEILKLR